MLEIKRTRRILLFAAAWLAGGCRASDHRGSPAGEGSASAQTAPAPATFTLWHYEPPDSAMGQAWQAAIQEFRRTHPGVTVKFEEKGFEQVQKTAPMVLNSDSAPDLLEYNKGNATCGLLSKQGLLSDLGPEVTARGWDQHLGPSVRTTSQYDEHGNMGSGRWYGVPNYAEYTVVYYNRELFEKYHLEIPKTFDQFVALLAAFKSNGVTPLANAGAEYMAQQYVYQLALSKAERSWVDAYQRYTGKVDFHDAAWTYAATTFEDWVKKGYIAKTSSGTKSEDAGLAFMAGKYPILFSGTWWFGRFMSQIKFPWGTFSWPGAHMTLGSGGNLWVVPKGAKNKQLAYDFIGITLSEPIQNILGNKGGVPVAAQASAIEDPRSKELIEGFNALSKNDGLAFYPDWPIPGFYDQLVSQTQKLITSSAGPNTYLDALQKAYDQGAPKK